MSETSTDLIVLPHTGEVVDLKAASEETLVDAHDAIDDYAKDLRSIKRQVDDELMARMDFKGKRTYHGEGFTLQASAATTREWDLDQLDVVLARLVREETISDRKAEACIRIKREPDQRELKTLEDDPRCTHAIRSCFQEVPANRYLKVKR